MMKTAMIVMNFQRTFEDMWPALLLTARLHDGWLPLQPSDRGARHVDPYFVGNLQRDAVAIDFDDLAVNPARRDDLVVLLQAFEERLHLLLLPPGRQQN